MTSDLLCLRDGTEYFCCDHDFLSGFNPTSCQLKQAIEGSNSQDLTYSHVSQLITLFA
jgi:hypothetical protein